jgi:tetratricopeptide (TPR) repeat protein
VLGDYGIDYEVEIFDEASNATGLFFLVQLKSSQQVTTDAVVIDLDHFDYWRELDRPVLLVRCDVGAKRTWARWIHDLDPHPRSPDQKSKTFHLGSEFAWSDETPNTLLQETRAWRAWRFHEVGQPLPLRLVIDSLPEESIVGLRRSLRNFVPRLGRLVELADANRADAAAIRLGPHETRVAIPGERHVVVDHPDGGDWKAETFGPDVMLLFAVALKAAGYDEPAGRIAAASRSASTVLSLVPNLAGPVVHALLDSGYWQDARQLINQVFAAGPDFREAASECVVVARAVSSGLNDPLLDREVVELAIEHYQVCERIGDQRLAAMAAYNAANAIRTVGDHGLALEWYSRAAELDSTYLERGYWHLERAGCLFLLGSLEDSEEAYGHALSLGEPRAALLLSDVKLAQGELDTARQLVDQTLSAGEDLDDLDRAHAMLTDAALVGMDRYLRAGADPSVVRGLDYWTVRLRDGDPQAGICAAVHPDADENLWAEALAHAAGAIDEGLLEAFVRVAQFRFGLSVVNATEDLLANDPGRLNRFQQLASAVGGRPSVFEMRFHAPPESDDSPE